MKLSQRSENDLQSFIVPPEQDGVRLDTFVCTVLPALSRRAVREAIACGYVQVDGHGATKGHRLRRGEVVQVTGELAHALYLQPNPELPVTILYTDDHIVAVDKPGGLPSHALRPYERRTVANFLLAHFPEMLSLSEAGLEAGLVHRLDTDTSGILLAARHVAARDALRAQFRARTVRKDYLALVRGAILEPGTIALPLEHHPQQRGKVRAAMHGGGRQAETFYWPLERYEGCTLLRVTIYTGVLHQIRAHLAAIGHPILGDPLYGARATDLKRQFLHATRIAFTHPISARQLELHAPLPPELAAVLARMRDQAWSSSCTPRRRRSGKRYTR